MEQWTTVGKINQYKSSSLNPNKHLDETFELYSVPSFDAKKPEIVQGSELGSNKQKVEEGDVLLCKINPRINRVWIVEHTTSYPLLASSEWIVVRSKNYLPKFLQYYFSSPKFRQFMNLQVTGIGGSLTRAQPKQVATYVVPVCSLDEQKNIVEQLDCIDSLLMNRQEAVENIDTLIKSRFVEMFGDPVLNPKNWKADVLKNLTSKIGSGATPKGGQNSYIDEGVSLVRSMNVHDGEFIYKDLAHINEQQAKELDNVTLQESDVLLNITGASVTRTCIVPSDVLPARVNQHVSIVRCNGELSSIFLNQQFLSDSYKRKLWSVAEAGGATRQAITKQQIESLKVIVPPIELQNKFANFVQQVDQAKQSVNASIETLQTLKASLMQKYFH